MNIVIEGPGVTDDDAYNLWHRINERLATREHEAGSTGFQVEREWSE